MAEVWVYGLAYGFTVLISLCSLGLNSTDDLRSLMHWRCSRERQREGTRTDNAATLNPEPNLTLTALCRTLEERNRKVRSDLLQ